MSVPRSPFTEPPRCVPQGMTKLARPGPVLSPPLASGLSAARYGAAHRAERRLVIAVRVTVGYGLGSCCLGCRAQPDRRGLAGWSRLVGRQVRLPGGSGKVGGDNVGGVGVETAAGPGPVVAGRELAAEPDGGLGGTAAEPGDDEHTHGSGPSDDVAEDVALQVGPVGLPVAGVGPGDRGRGGAGAGVVDCPAGGAAGQLGAYCLLEVGEREVLLHLAAAGRR